MLGTLLAFNIETRCWYRQDTIHPKRLLLTLNPKPFLIVLQCLLPFAVRHSMPFAPSSSPPLRLNIQCLLLLQVVRFCGSAFNALCPFNFSAFAVRHSMHFKLALQTYNVLETCKVCAIQRYEVHGWTQRPFFRPHRRRR